MNAPRTRLIQDSLIAGFVGYLTVVLFFVLWNLALGRSPLYTAALLGEGIFAGLRDPSAVALDPGLILAFNALHLAAFLVFGFFAAWLVYETELHPEFWYLAFFLFLAATVLSYAVVLALTVLVGNLLSPFLVVGSSLVGALAMAGYLVMSHRPLAAAIQRSDEAQAAAE